MTALSPRNSTSSWSRDPSGGYTYDSDGNVQGGVIWPDSVRIDWE
jgi:hypothetical protein